MVQIAQERIELLIREADGAALGGRMDLADRYVWLARRIGMRYNVRVPAAHKRRFCKRCYRYLLPGVTSRTRLKRGRSVTTCLRCGHVMRVPLVERSTPEAKEVVSAEAADDGLGEEGGDGGGGEWTRT
jgi:ribonuclease P protein subunit RPR2